MIHQRKGTYRAKTSSVKQLGYGRSQRGIGVGGQNSVGNTMAPGRGVGTTGKASHRGHRDHRVGIGFGIMLVSEATGPGRLWISLGASFLLIPKLTLPTLPRQAEPSVTSVRCFCRLRVFLVQKPSCPQTDPRHSPSVTSVRCFPFPYVSRPEATVSNEGASVPIDFERRARK
jgi:hypothetical protein